jgi:hypothetical protein
MNKITNLKRQVEQQLRYVSPPLKKHMRQNLETVVLVKFPSAHSKAGFLR